MSENKPKLIPILYEDEQLIAFDKPPGLLVIPAPDKKLKTLTAIVNEEYSNRTQHGNFHPVHRLDRDTSGVILYAKGKKNQQVMMGLFQEKEIDKVYIAIAHGRLKEGKGVIKKAISGMEQKKFRRNVQPQMAVTNYLVIEQRKEFAILEVRPITGRTNQIRIHFSGINHPLVGERKYAFARDFKINFKRPALHAHKLDFKHPWTGQPVHIQSELAKDMEVFLARNSNER